VPNGAISGILDLGCGTGRYSEALAGHFDAQVIAIHRSAKMLAEARKKSAPRVEYARASGESLPLRDSSVEPFRVAPPGSWRSVSIKILPEERGRRPGPARHPYHWYRATHGLCWQIGNGARFPNRPGE
jgi:SAM-dependent methyltransferase